MFTKPTVFIIGAGASWHYGFPTGEDLVRQVIRKSKELADLFGNGFKFQSGRFPAYTKRNHPIEEDATLGLWTKAASEAIELHVRLSRANPTVIDYFLAQNADLHDIGRFAIALVIFECEYHYVKQGGNPNHQLLHDRAVAQGRATGGKPLTAAAFYDDWVRFIQYKLTAGCNGSEDLLKNNVRFITFNYDNSLEHRLFMGLSSISRLKPVDVSTFLDRGRVLHVYGAIREKVDASWEEIDPTIEMNPDTDSFWRSNERLDKVFAASQGIRTIDGDEKTRNTMELNAAADAIENAEVAYILGFGFDPVNVKRLDLSKLRPDRAGSRSVFFTNYGGHNRVSMAAGRALLGGPGVFLESPVKQERNHYNNTAYNYRYEMSTKNVYDAFAEDFDSLET